MLAIGRAFKLCRVLTRLVGMSKYDQRGKKGLAQFKLSDDKWQLLEQLHELLVVSDFSLSSGFVLIWSHLIDVLARNRAGIIL